MCVCVYVRIYGCVSVCVRVCVYARAPQRRSPLQYVYVCVCSPLQTACLKWHVHMCLNAYSCIVHMYMCVSIHACGCIDTCICMYVHICARAHMRASTCSKNNTMLAMNFEKRCAVASSARAKELCQRTTYTLHCQPSTNTCTKRVLNILSHAQPPPSHFPSL